MLVRHQQLRPAIRKLATLMAIQMVITVAMLLACQAAKL
jgi:hypothetical protein